MQFTLHNSLRGRSSEVLVLGWFEQQKLADHTWWSALPVSLRTTIQQTLKKRGNTLEWGAMHTVSIPKGSWPQLVIIGLGKRSAWSNRRHRLMARRLIRLAASKRWGSLTIAFQRLNEPFVQSIVENCLLGAYEYRVHKQTPKLGWPEVKSVALVSTDATPQLTQAIRRGVIIADAVNHARDLANTPGGSMTPRTLAAAAVRLGKTSAVKVKILTPAQMKKLQMGALLGVGMGSDEEPRLIVMEYRGAPASSRPLVFVGKGITFDSGGYNLKPGNSMSEMHMDMSGGAAAMTAISAIAKLKLPINIVAIIPAAENMVSGSGFRPGDILQSMSGLNIEIGNTDAEGRLVLADGLTYGQKFYRPRLIVDIATLTGAALVALGQEAAALLTKQPELQSIGQEIGEASGDYVWPLPLWEEYDHLVQATFGDVTNSGKSRWGGTIEGAVFLSKFIKDTPWIHLDIAPTMSSAEGQHLAPGATGVGVRWLVTLAERIASGTLTV